MSPQEILSNRITDLCNEKGMSYYTLSYKSAIPISTLLRIIKGSTKNPGILAIYKICSGLDITVHEFFDTQEFIGIENEE